ncbi:hypothetical protein [Saccharopolyspora rosea]|uniref:hypothetical protein n=1 Tax=Saccharopolyspora rosea TaxID=524884 RepID=UPI0021DAE572|nr:hypothetical protein [Saccharopolyspora rosea]
MATYAFDEHTGRLLDAGVEDCGWPDNPELHWPRFYETRKTVRCEKGHQLIAKQRRRPDGEVTRFWSHLSGERDHEHPQTAPEGIEHKILKARVMAAFRRAGCTPVNKEVSGSGYRSALQFQVPSGQMHAAEIQVSAMIELNAIRRTLNALNDGLRSVIWMTARDEEPWNRQVPCVGIQRATDAPERGYAIEDIPLRVVRGLHLPVERDCDDQPTCWRGRMPGKHCPGRHLSFVSRAASLGIDAFAEEVASGRLVVVKVPYEPPKRGHFWLLSTPAAAEQAHELDREVEKYRAWRQEQRRRAPRHGRPSRSPACSLPTAPHSDPKWAEMKNCAPSVARKHSKTVWIIRDARRFLDQQRHPAAAIGPRTVALVKSEADRRMLIAAGIPGDRVEVASPEQLDGYGTTT